ncbi:MULTISPECIES: hypothetical protein [unclassified Arthrobacter]|uniref:hypothetical protein n=1 Tax=unclassified Arthrobacter TaxID=235627 RepID=UPI00159E10BA|nr:MULTISPECIES: hypothetical protein [unclassified Arthrobacter]MCQ9162924.1 hypothetical protein [Arthrobacter sp. STN4]NVM97459.1 hypothetical protein [Arthrobacter sp. SDTb3-6]
MEKIHPLAGQALTLMVAGQRLLARWLSGWLAGPRHFRLRPAAGRTRGDVPGWVLITLMSAVLVAGLLAIAGPALAKMFNEAMDQVHP